MLTKDLDYYLGLPYLITLQQDEDDEGPYWVARIPELPGCRACGRTQAETLESLDAAKRAWLESSIEHGDIISEPLGGGRCTQQD